MDMNRIGVSKVIPYYTFYVELYRHYKGILLLLIPTPISMSHCGSQIS